VTSLNEVTKMSMLNEAWGDTQSQCASAPEFDRQKPSTSCYDGFQC